MKQLLQNLRNGETTLEEVPVPAVSPQQLLIQTELTLVSVGTEKMLVDFGRAGLLSKIKQQPDKVRMVMDKVRTDGLFATLDTINAKLDNPIPLGYCNVGRVVAIGKEVSGFVLGERVISNGHHAEYVAVGKNLCAKIPENVSSEAAAFTVLGAIALQGIRLLAPALGETIVVMGLGLIGLLTVQILRAQGCQVLAIDLDADKVKAAQEYGAAGLVLRPDGVDPVLYAQQFTGNLGVDGVIITANTQSSTPVHQAASMCRKRGRIILVGVTGLELSRADFYEKELTFQVSCSYGPGRYDPHYEVDGHDYPASFVRWTQQRNFQAILHLLAEQKLSIEPLITHRFDIAQAAQAYELFGKAKIGGLILRYPTTGKSISHKIEYPSFVQLHADDMRKSASPKIGFIGSGNYATRHLIPAFAKTSAQLLGVSCRAGISGARIAKKFNMAIATTDNNDLIESASCNVLVISTQHNTHAQLVLAGLQQGKHIFVEKPLCISQQQLNDISYQMSHQAAGLQLMVGFNRRFSPLMVKLKQLTQQVHAPLVMQYEIQAGFIPANHWTQNRDIGGGRLLGEVCHFVDACRFLAGCSIVNASAVALASNGLAQDSILINLAFADGSIANINYFCNGNKAIAKEKLTVHSAGKTAILDNFRKLHCYGFSAGQGQTLWQQNKGQQQCVSAFVNAISQMANCPIPFEEIREVMQVCITLDTTLYSDNGA
jgi:predicted dehydrogenase/threonine dehydrogenase-like Zn-dependent dehydrogenase